MLFACIFVPSFVVQALIRCEPEIKRLTWNSRPIAVFDGPESLPRIVAINEPAALAGIELGSTKTQASQCSDILLRKSDVKQQGAAQEAVVDCASQFSPRVESTAPGIVTLDITGTERIFGPTQKLLRQIAERVARVGLEVNVAAAANPDTAWIAAKGFPGITVVPEGKEAESIARLPVEVLPVSEAQEEILDSWGIRTCRDLALLPPVPLAERLRETGFRLQKLARGESSRMLVPVDARPSFCESMEFEDAIHDLESLVFACDQLLKQIAARLISRSLATDELRVTLGLEVHKDRQLNDTLKTRDLPETFERVLRLPVSMQDPGILLKLLQLDLSEHKPEAAVKRVELEARPAKRRFSQGDLFSAFAPDPEKLEVTLARIRGVVGDSDEQGRGRVGCPELVNSHRPDAFQVFSFAAQDHKEPIPERLHEGSITLSMFRPPVKARVVCQGGTPVHISFEKIATAIISVAGPWMSSGNWWKEDEEWRREEWDIAIQLREGVGLYRIYRDLRKDSWFLEGLYD